MECFVTFPVFKIVRNVDEFSAVVMIGKQMKQKWDTGEGCGRKKAC